MHPAIIVGIVAAPASAYVLTRLVVGRRALNIAEDAVDELGAEVSSAIRGGEERYRTRMPDRNAFARERDASEDILTILVGQVKALRQKPLREKLSRAFTAQCRTIVQRARKAKSDLESEAFWAQFEPGSPWANSRYNTD